MPQKSNDSQIISLLLSTKSMKSYKQFQVRTVKLNLRTALKVLATFTF